jgi:hypothetical protein
VSGSALALRLTHVSICRCDRVAPFWWTLTLLYADLHSVNDYLEIGPGRSSHAASALSFDDSGAGRGGLLIAGMPRFGCDV